MTEPNSARLLVFEYRYAQRDRPVFQGCKMSMMMGKGKPDVHVGWQYIHINGIWQEEIP